MIEGEQAEDWKARHEAAYEAFDRGALGESIPHFAALADTFPDRTFYHYMLGLAHKYRREWEASLLHNLKAMRDDGGDQQGEHWNAAIAATALGNWQEARRQWQLCGLQVEPGDEPIDGNWGNSCVRLNPWANGETVYTRRTSPAVAILLNVPFAHSGYRYGDHVLVDGAKTGERRFGDATVPVFNALQRLRQSDYKTYVVTVQCADETDSDDLADAKGAGIGSVEDWTASVRYLCRKCSYGEPHTHEEASTETPEWQLERSFGIAALSRADVDTFLTEWLDRGSPKGKITRLFARRPARKVLQIDDTDHEIPAPCEDHVWWSSTVDD